MFEYHFPVEKQKEPYVYIYTYLSVFVPAPLLYLSSSFITGDLIIFSVMLEVLVNVYILVIFLINMING